MPMVSARKAGLATSVAPTTEKIRLMDHRMGRRMDRTRQSEAAANNEPQLHVHRSYQYLRYWMGMYLLLYIHRTWLKRAADSNYCAIGTEGKRGEERD